MASGLPKVVTATIRFSCLDPILVFGWIFGFWGFNTSWDRGSRSIELGRVSLLKAQPPDSCFSQLSFFTLDAIALRLGFFVFKLDWVSIDCGLLVRKSFKPSPLMTEL